jgi:hypothetical protein
MATTMLRKDQLEFLLGKLETQYKHLIASYRSTWRSDEDRESARQALTGMVTEARQAVESLRGADAPELQSLRGKLLVQAELADGTLKNPSTLRR